jgi:hypothetical protein
MALPQIFVDTGAWYAYINAKDPDHLRIRSFFDSFNGRLVTSNYVFDEIITLVLSRLGHQKAVKVGEVLLDLRTVELVRVEAKDEKSAWQLFQERQDKTYSFTDCTSFVLMQRLKLGEASTTDEHFSQEGFKVLP